MVEINRFVNLFSRGPIIEHILLNKSLQNADLSFYEHGVGGKAMFVRKNGTWEIQSIKMTWVE
jgi:hypothetical protein